MAVDHRHSIRLRRVSVKLIFIVITVSISPLSTGVSVDPLSQPVEPACAVDPSAGRAGTFDLIPVRWHMQYDVYGRRLERSPTHHDRLRIQMNSEARVRCPLSQKFRPFLAGVRGMARVALALFSDPGSGQSREGSSRTFTPVYLAAYVHDHTPSPHSPAAHSARETQTDRVPCVRLEQPLV